MPPFKSGNRVEDGDAVTSIASIHTNLRSDILRGTLRPGNKDKIDELAARYAISHIPIREALSGLVAEGLVKREERRGFFVVALSVEMLEELVRTRSWLEERALTEAIAHRSVQWEEQLVLALHWLSRTPRYDDEHRTVLSRDWERRHKQFHHALISACPSSILLRYCKELRDRVDSYRFMIESEHPRPFEARPDEHRSIAERALAGDTSGAVEQLLTHYRGTLEIIRAHMA